MFDIMAVYERARFLLKRAAVTCRPVVAHFILHRPLGNRFSHSSSRTLHTRAMETGTMFGLVFFGHVDVGSVGSSCSRLLSSHYRVTMLVLDERRMHGCCTMSELVTVLVIFAVS